MPIDFSDYGDSGDGLSPTAPGCPIPTNSQSPPQAQNQIDDSEEINIESLIDNDEINDDEESHWGEPAPSRAEATSMQALRHQSVSSSNLSSAENRNGTKASTSRRRKNKDKPQIQKPKKSKFKGVHWDSKRGSWCCRVRKAGISRRCASEIEAAVHYNAVARVIWPDTILDPENTTKKLNNPWLVRPNIGYGQDRDGYPYMRIDIDAVDFVMVDNVPALYRALKDMDWFIKDGEAVIIRRFNPETKEFVYWKMSEMILDEPAYHLSGDKMDNRRQNLAPLREKAQRDAELERQQAENRPINPIRDFRPTRRTLTPLEREYIRRLERYEKWHREFREHGRASGDEPVDPRKIERFFPLL